MRWHPDRQGDASADAAETAAFRMQELNAAWAVLRSPARRAAYDDELAATDATDATPSHRPGDRPSGASPPTARPTGTAGFGSPVPTAGSTAARPPSPVPWGCLGVIITCVVLALVVTAYAAANRAGRPDIDVDVREPYATGACVRLPEGRTGQVAVLEVTCDGPHDAVVAERTVFPRSCGADTVVVLLSDRATQLCLEPR